jgi:hypothetical protein
VAVPGARLLIERIGGKPAFGLAPAFGAAATTADGPMMDFMAPGVAANSSLKHTSGVATKVRPANKQKNQFFLKVSISPSFKNS